ncbi:MAG: hypothetical protein ACC642_04205 [Pseudomonadales bacterium]
MFEVVEVPKKSGREAVLVRRKNRLVGAASVTFVQWMHRHVPTKQLSPEQVALVEWFEQHQIH